jgi:parallel beta-helix repeat protein
MVCPGSYAQQITISQPLTLEGVTDGTGNAAVITVPGGGLTLNAFTNPFGNVTAQVLVENTVGVTINGITIDGSGSTCVPGAGRTVGLLYFNVGMANDGYLGGKIQNVVVRNIGGCGGEGVVADTSYLTISHNEFHGLSRTPITAYGGQNMITGNSVQNCLNGFVITNGTTLTVASSNTISNLNSFDGYTTTGMWVNGGSAIVKQNTLSTSTSPYSNVGVYLPGTAAGTSITGNTVNGVTYGVQLSGAAGTTVQGNFFSGDYLGVYDEFSNGENTITKNTVNEGTYGIFAFSPADDVLTPNSFYNTITTIDPSEPTDTLNVAN